jgi:hypothetical protein
LILRVETFDPFFGGCQLLPAESFGSQLLEKRFRKK